MFRMAWYTSSTVVEMKRLLTGEAVANYTFQSVVPQESLRFMRTPHIENVWIEEWFMLSAVLRPLAGGVPPRCASWMGS